MALTKIGTDIIADDAITADKIAAGALDTQLAGYLSTNSFATETYVGTAISNLVDSSPATLDTLNELAAALGDDPNFATTTATAIGLKAPIASPTFTGTVTADGLIVNKAAIISTTDYYGASTFTTELKGVGVNSKSALLLNSFSASGQPALVSIHSEPIADYRAALVATYSADGSGAGYFAVNQFVPTSSATQERLRIDSAGNVGIGTDTPTDKLEIRGNAKIEQTSNVDAIIRLNPNSGTLGSNYRWDLVGSNSAASYSFQIREGTTPYLTINNSAGGNAGNVGIGTSSVTSKLSLFGTQAAIDFQRGAGDSKWALSSDSENLYIAETSTGTPNYIMALNAGGNVGIGTNTPTTSPVGAFAWASPVTTIAGTRPTLYLNGSSNYTTLRMWPSGTDGSSTAVDDWHVNTVHTGAGGYMSFSPQGGALGQAGLNLKTNGNVGIGTNAPGVTLDISTSTANTNGVVRIQNKMDNDYEALRIHSFGNFDAQIGFLSQGTSTYWGAFGIDYSDAGKFKLQTDNLFVGGSNLMTWARDGKVGIGTSAPTAKLEISGFSSGAGLKLNYGNSSGTIEAVNFIANGGANGVIGMQMVSAGVGDLWLGGSGGRSLTLYRNGNVGIGTSSPPHKLSVEHTAAGTIASFFDTGSNGGTMYNGAAVLGVSRVSNGSTSLNGPIFQVGRDNSSSTSYNIDDVLFSVNSTGVGIGTSSPSSPLHVIKNAGSDVTPIATFGTSVAGDYGIVVIDSGADNNYRPSTLRFHEGGNLKWEIGGTYQLVDDTFGIRNTSGAYKMVIEQDGNVGIGTTSVTSPGLWYDANPGYLAISHWATPPTPAAMLHLSDNSNDLDVPQIRIEGRESAGDTKLDISVKDAAARFNLVEGPASDANNGFGQMIFKTNAVANATYPARGGFLFSTPANANNLVITNTGNVGIGTSSPSATLEIKPTGADGSFKVTSDANSGNNVVISQGYNTYITASNNLYMGVGGTANNLSIVGGNVGIGTTSPLSYLHVKATSVDSSNGLRLEYNTGIPYYSRIKQHGNDLHIMADTTNTGGTMRFYAATDNYADTPIMTLNPAGVGIHQALDITYKDIGTAGSTTENSPNSHSTKKYFFRITADGAWRKVLGSFNDMFGSFTATISDTASGDVALYTYRVTSPAYGVSSFSQTTYTEGGWNTGTFAFRILAVDNVYQLECQYQSYYSSANTGLCYMTINRS
jgi:hypothetical protein